RRLFPDEVKTCDGGFEDLEGVLFPEEDAFIRQAIASRRREFLAGRVCARRALAQLGMIDVPLPVKADRTAAWPPGVVGSLAHPDGFCGAGVAQESAARALGFDLESLSDFRLEYLRMICTEHELRWLARLPARERHKTGALIFSAKESFYKCQYPLTREWLGFRHVEIEIDSTSKDFGEFAASLLVDLSPAFIKSFTLTGKYTYEIGLIMTGIVMGSRPPVRLPST